MSIELDVQRQTNNTKLPDDTQFMCWVEQAIQVVDAQLSIRLVDEKESQQLNKQYRHKNKATNVLSFEVELPADIDLPLQGDLVICAAVIEQEAVAQNKRLLDHWAHIVIHGVLHLQGYDHLNEQQASEMENLEINLLQKLGIQNPYETVSI